MGVVPEWMRKKYYLTPLLYIRTKHQLDAFTDVIDKERMKRMDKRHLLDVCLGLNRYHPILKPLYENDVNFRNLVATLLKLENKKVVEVMFRLAFAAYPMGEWQTPVAAPMPAPFADW
jgi:hypothetical protein